MLPLFGQYHAATAISVLCMGGGHTGPITSFIIVMRMVDGHGMVISLMAIALIAAIIFRIFSTPLYLTLAEKLDSNIVGVLPKT